MIEAASATYIKEIGRGKEGARALSREQARDLFGQVLDGSVSDLEIGAFCIAMRIKGETPEEMAGFLDAVHARLRRLPASTRPLVVLPSYNGARKLPGADALAGAAAGAQEGLPVLVHGAATEDSRVTTSRDVLAQRWACTCAQQAIRIHRRLAASPSPPPRCCCPAWRACWTCAACSACATARTAWSS
jgi:anthranilate phosphoribosyltransferase